MVDADHYKGGPHSGQIRTNQFMAPAWTLREFKVEGARIVPTTVKSNPGNLLFESSHLHSDDFANYLVKTEVLGKLRGAGNEESVDTFSFEMALDNLNSFESDARTDVKGDVVSAFVADGELGKLRSKLDKALRDANSKLTADHIIHRLRTQTCAGCHHWSAGDGNKELGVKDLPDGWPIALDGFTHVTETKYESGEDDKLASLPSKLDLESLKSIRPKRRSHLDFKGPDCMGNDRKDCRFMISNTLKHVLLPPRFELMVLYLNDFDPPN